MAILLIIIFFSVLILVHELGHFLTAKRFGVWVKEFGFGLPPRIYGKKFKETIYSLNLFPFGGFVKIFGEDQEEEKETKEVVPKNKKAFHQLPIFKRAIIILAGVIMNFLLGWLILVGIFMVGTEQGVFIVEVVKNSPAEKVGLAAGDKIVKINNVSVFSENEPLNSEKVKELINQSRGKELVLTIEREGKLKELKVVPRKDPPQGEGALGVALIDGGIKAEGFSEAIVKATISSIKIFSMIFVAIVDLIKKLVIGEKVLEALTGPVGIFKISAQAVDFGLVYFFQLIALISINLAAINIFPFPALDGGRLIFLLIEKIKGSPVNPKIEKVVNGFGFLLLILLMILITIKDIQRLF